MNGNLSVGTIVDRTRLFNKLQQGLTQCDISSSGASSHRRNLLDLPVAVSEFWRDDQLPLATDSAMEMAKQEGGRRVSTSTTDRRTYNRA